MDKRRLPRLFLIILVFFFAFFFFQIGRAQLGIALVIHSVRGNPLPDRMAYEVRVYLSVTDSNGTPIRGLSTENFTVREDGQRVEIESLNRVDEPIHLVLAMDTSGSMVGAGIEAARAAAVEFVDGLDIRDRLAILTFENAVQMRMELGDRRAAREQIAQIEAVRDAGTCLYDAAYRAVQVCATFPPGRRAVLLFTDGVDENAEMSGPCSIHTLDDVIALATTEGTRVPIYTLGLGKRIDDNTLRRLADRTGGRHLYSPEIGQVEAMFLRLSEQLRTQYLLRYISTSGPGAHSVAVSVNYEGAGDTDTRDFLLPPFPLRAALTSPQEGQQVSGTLRIAVAISGQGEPVDHVTFEINGREVGRDEIRPYEVEVDIRAYPPGEVTVTAVLYGIGEVELARAAGRAVVVSVPPTEAPQERAWFPSLSLSREVIIGGIGGLAFLSLLLVTLMIGRRRARARPAAPAAWAAGTPARVEERTYDVLQLTGALGVLVVEGSEDPTMIGYRFEITRPVVTLGRSADNDMVFPKDRAVSRHHARIEGRGGGLFLSEVETLDQTGRPRRPTYGTMVNGLPLGKDPTLLHSGDEIMLGKHLRLRFLAAGTAESEAPTCEGIPFPEDRTRTLG